jgi:hypothetical protein
LEVLVVCVNEGSFSSFYSLQGRLLADLRMETPGIDFTMIRPNLLPKCT